MTAEKIPGGYGDGFGTGLPNDVDYTEAELRALAYLNPDSAPPDVLPRVQASGTGGEEAPAAARGSETPSRGRSPRGTTNGNRRGSSEDRRRRCVWLVETYRADVDLAIGNPLAMGGRMVPACRCYRCGVLLTVETVTVDRIIPGCRGGTYRRTNIRPACGSCNSETGGAVRSKP